MMAKEYIEREAAIEWLKRRRDSERFPKTKYAGLESAIFQIKHLPAADVVEARLDAAKRERSVTDYFNGDAVKQAFDNECVKCVHFPVCSRLMGGMNLECCQDYQHTVGASDAPHGECPVCGGKQVVRQDCDNGYYVEVDAEQQEMSVWLGDECLAVFSIDYCPNCGAKMDGKGEGE